MKTIMAAINLLITAAFGGLKIYRIAKGSGTAVEKIKNTHDQLERIIGKLDTLAQTTDPTWDDSLASALSSALEVVAESLIESLQED